MKYEEYSYHELSEKLQIKHKNHLVALYLNITSCLTKLNKKDDAILSAEEGLKM